MKELDLTDLKSIEVMMRQYVDDLNNQTQSPKQVAFEIRTMLLPRIEKINTRISFKSFLCHYYDAQLEIGVKEIIECQFESEVKLKILRKCADNEIYKIEEI